MQEFDFIVVGAGTAGCVLAGRLSESGRHTVLLVEEGGEARSLWTRVPIGYSRLFSNKAYNRNYTTAPEPGFQGRRLDQYAGRGLGGTGTINGLVYMRGHPADYDGWAAAGNAGWSWSDVLPWFLRSESNSRGASAFHGGDGPWHIADLPHRHPLADAFIAAAQQAGLPRNDDFNGASQEGAGYFQLSTRKGIRSSTATAYLAPARKRPNLAVITHAVVSRVLFENGEATGIEYVQGGMARRAKARIETVLAAGTFNTPQLLQVSGVGPADLVRSLGVPVVADSPGVGANLQNHLRANVMARCRQPVTLNDSMRSLRKRIAMGVEYLLRRDGPMAAPAYAGAFLKSAPGIATPDIQLVMWTYTWTQRNAKGLVLHDFPGFTTNATFLRPRSRGTVRALEADMREAPEISYRFLEDPADGAALVSALKAIRRILGQAAMAPYFEAELEPSRSRLDDAALLDLVRSTGGSVFHPVGTCRMGNDAGAVVDTRLRVKGINRLRVADASVMPTIVSGNTNAPTVMIAERAADWMLRDALAA